MGKLYQKGEQEKKQSANFARPAKKTWAPGGAIAAVSLLSKRTLPVRRCGALFPRPKRERPSRNMGGRPIFVSSGPRLRP